MKTLFTVLAFAFVSPLSFAASEVNTLSAASFSSSLSVGPRSLTVEYQSGGCGRDGHKTRYKLEMLSQKEDNDGLLIATVKVHVLAEPNGGCRMAYTVKDTVDLNTLLKAQGQEIGLLTKKDQTTYVKFEVPRVIGSTFVAE